MKSQKKEVAKRFATSLFILFLILVLEEVLNSLVRNHLLIKDVSTRLGALYHLDNLCISATIL